MTETNTAEQARAVIKEYVDACNEGDVSRLRAIFHEQAVMSGYMMDDFLIGSAEPFFQAVASPPPEAPPNPGNYKGEITEVDVAGEIATITLKEVGFMGLNFTNYFHLVKVDDTWLIVSKTFNSEM